MVRQIWRETDRIKAGKNFKVTESKFSNVTALNGLAKFYCIIVSADRTLQIYATICIFQKFPCRVLNCLCRTRGFPKALFIDLLVLVLHMVRQIWRETDRIKAGKNFKVTESKFSNVTALNGLAKFYCIIVSADRTLQIYATICIFQIVGWLFWA